MKFMPPIISYTLEYKYFDKWFAKVRTQIMNSFWKLIRNYLQNISFIRHTHRILTGWLGFMYDYKRFLAYGGWQDNMNDREQRNYKQVIYYHRLEKSLSFKVKKFNFRLE